MFARLRDDSVHSPIPVIVISGTLSDRVIRSVYDTGANACIENPEGPDELEETVRAIESFWLSAATLPTVDE